MLMKQNYNYITDRYYPELSSKPNSTSFSQQKQKSRVLTKCFPKNSSEKKLESKLKSIITNIEKSLKQEQAFKKKKHRENSHDVSSVKQFDRQVFKNRLRSVSHKDLKMGKIHRVHTENKLDESDIEYILKKKTDRTTIGRESRQSNRSTNVVALPRIKSTKKYEETNKLDEKEYLLGKMVLDKVEKHFDKEKSGTQNYYDRVKSQQSIDSSLIEYLKHKVKKANISIHPHQK